MRNNLILQKFFVLNIVFAFIGDFDCSSQIPIDSNLRVEILNHPKVDTLVYVKEYYRIGKLRFEGWAYESEYLYLSDSIPSDLDDDITYLHKIGISHRYYKNGNIIRIDTIPFSDTVYDSSILFDKKGYRIEMTKSRADQNRETGEVEGFNGDGDFMKYYHYTRYYKKSDKIEQVYHVCDPVVICGEYRFYYKNGLLGELSNYNDKEELDGDFIDYYSNGKIKSKGVYQSNQKIGKWDYFEENGELITDPKKLEKLHNAK